MLKFLSQGLVWRIFFLAELGSFWMLVGLNLCWFLDMDFVSSLHILLRYAILYPLLYIIILAFQKKKKLGLSSQLYDEKMPLTKVLILHAQNTESRLQLPFYLILLGFLRCKIEIIINLLHIHKQMPLLMHTWIEL